MKLQLTKKQYKEYLSDVIFDLQSESLLEEIGQLIFDINTVKYIPLVDGFEVIEHGDEE